jgi:hypothetical protein
MVTSQAIIDRMNNMTSTVIIDEATPMTTNVTPEVQTAPETRGISSIVEDAFITQQPADTVDVASPINNEDDDVVEETPEQPEEPEMVEAQRAEVETAPARRSARIAQGITPPDRYLLLNKIKATTDKIAQKEQAKFEAIQKEVLQLFQELEALMPVMKSNIPEDAEVLRCFIFLVEKFLANGEFDKIKARLVANGAQQNRELYPNKSSPTASMHAIFTCFAIVAYKGNYDVAKIDVKGAYIQTEITGSPIYMKMDKRLTSIILSILPSLQAYVTPEGTLYTKLLKALYGCVQSGQLWYTKIAKVLRREGYISTPTDPCIFRKVNQLYILILYVDDILLFADQEEIDRVQAFMKQEFKWITVVKGKVQSYIGMNIEVSSHKVIVNMSHYTQQLLLEFKKLREYSTPAVKECFQSMTSGVVLDIDEKRKFHTIVAKLLYLAKRVRPDILTATSFLCTRVKQPTKADQQKLLRVMGYLKRTQNFQYTITPTKPLQVVAYIDAAFAAHEDSKSHSGVAVFIAGVLVYAASKKQQCVTKSPTESELVALSDYVGFVELFHEFVSFLISEQLSPPIIYQDSTSVITLVTQGGGVTRTRHLRNRMHLVKEAVDNEKINVRHCKTNDMIADGFTKPLEGVDFKHFIKALYIFCCKSQPGSVKQ